MARNTEVTTSFNPAEKLLSSYEKGVLAMSRPSDGDGIVQGAIVKEKLKQVLGLSIKTTLPDNTVVDTDAATLMVIGAVADAIQKPSSSKLKDFAVILGETKENTVEANISLADKALREMAIKRNPDEPR